jgi:hypothetical protein
VALLPSVQYLWLEIVRVRERKKNTVINTSSRFLDNKEMKKGSKIREYEWYEVKHIPSSAIHPAAEMAPRIPAWMANLASSGPTELWLEQALENWPSTFLSLSTHTVRVLVPPPSNPSTTFPIGDQLVLMKCCGVWAA